MKEFFASRKHLLSDYWSIEEKANQLALLALEHMEDLPELSLDGGPGMSQEEFDREIEGVFTSLVEEAKRWLNNMCEPERHVFSISPMSLASSSNYSASCDCGKILIMYPYDMHDDLSYKIIVDLRGLVQHARNLMGGT